jgi:hypothetical protein
MGKFREEIVSLQFSEIFGNFEHVKLQDKDRLQDIESDFSTTVNKYAWNIFVF